MKNKTGFTLAEILITLAIIGVTAALTLPSFVSNTKKNVWGNSLSVAIANWEKAFSIITIRDGVYSLLETKAWLNLDRDAEGELNNEKNDTIINQFVASISSTLHVKNHHKDFNNYYNSETIKELNSNGIAGNEIGMNLKHIGIETNRKNIYWITLFKGQKLLENDAIERGTMLTQQIGEVIIDINGNDKPNIIGRDLFKFYLNEDGKLYPIGGRDINLYEDSAPGLWSEESSENSCVNDKIKTGWGCTARLIEDNFNFKY